MAGMNRCSFPLVLPILLAFGGVGVAQVPSAATLALSLKTMGKALLSCHEIYAPRQPTGRENVLRTVLGEDAYSKDLASMSAAEKLTLGMATNPERITGRALVAALSSSDDLSIGIGSTRLALLAALMQPSAPLDGRAQTQLMVISTSLADCQKALFNAGDDFVGLVLQYVQAEDLASSRNMR